MPPASVREFFEALPARADPVKTAGMKARYRFDIAPAGSWVVDVDHGAVSVVEGEQPADVTIGTSEELFLRILSGEQNPMTAYLRGKLRIDGDTSLALKLQKLF